MRRLSILLAGILTTAAVAAAPAGAAPLFADTWDYEMQSTRYRGPVGHFEGSWNFKRPNIIFMHIPGYGRSKPRPLRPRAGWLVATFSEVRKCVRVAGGKQNYYRYRQVVRLRPTRVHDMEGEQVASAARLRFFGTTKPCIGRRISGTFLGRAKREEGPERGGVDIFYEAPDGCQPSVIEHDGDEDDSFVDWDRAFSYLWQFSDGTTSTAREPTHTYPGPGIHSATLLIRSINGSVAIGTQAIEVSEPDPDCN